MRYHFKKKIEIGDRWIGEGEPCFVVAEIGLNHNGDIKLAKKLIDAAVGCGADAVKFQKRTVDKILTKEALDAPYDTWYAYGKTYGEHRKALELSNEEFIALQEYASERDIIFFASPWDEESADFLEGINVSIFKVASADVINLPLIKHMAKKRKPMIVSTGMSTFDEIKDAVDMISKYTDELILLQCVSTYPSDYEEINLRNMETLRKTFDCPVGYSGHERGIAVSEAAVALGACVVERHFTLDRALKGPDHAASLEPPGLFKLIRDIKNVEKSMGASEKRAQERETPIRTKLAKSVVAAVDISKGTVITKEMLGVKGPNIGLPPKYVYILPGKRAVKDIKEDSAITEEMVE
jgi:sialic acid synthase SpsE